MTQSKNSCIIPLVFMGLMLFSVGFALGINSYSGPLLQGALGASTGLLYLILGNIAMFLYVGVGIIAPVTMVNYVVIGPVRSSGLCPFLV